MRRLLITVTLIALAVAASGCSEDAANEPAEAGSDSTTATPSTAPTTTTTAPATTTTTTTTTTTLPTTSTSTTAASETDPLVGMWETHHGYYVAREADGYLGLGYTPEQAQSNPWGWGTYTFDEAAGVFTFTSDPGTHCGADSTGVYEAVITEDGDTVTFTLIEDPCAARPANMTGEQTRYSPAP